MTKSRVEGHRDRLHEEIVAYLKEYMSEYDLPVPVLVETDDYIRRQTLRILEQMYQEDADPHPDEVDPNLIEGDYYRESIAEFGTLYVDFPMD